MSLTKDEEQRLPGDSAVDEAACRCKPVEGDAVEGAGEARCPSPSYDPKELGRKGEQAAARFLERRGMEILEMNWECPAGEADIIALDEDALCFIEVKTRTQVEKGFPEEAVTAQKRSRYEKIAAWYLRTYERCDVRVRFDVVSILVVAEHRAFLRYHTNAFGAG